MGKGNIKDRFNIIVRHGELNNPKGIVYNRDVLMRREDSIGLSEEGKEQMKALATLLKNKDFQAMKIYTSPEKRAQESAEELNKILKVPIVVNDDLDDVYGPGPYLEGVTMDQWEKEYRGDAYSKRWEKYDCEKPEAIIERMSNAFWKASEELKPGKAAILVSHGDPIAWFVNSLLGEIPEPHNLRNLTYPTKGEALVAVISPDDKLAVIHELNKRPNRSTFQTDTITSRFVVYNFMLGAGMLNG